MTSSSATPIDYENDVLEYALQDSPARLSFSEFIQEPFCDYVWTYTVETVTAEEKPYWINYYKTSDNDQYVAVYAQNFALSGTEMTFVVKGTLMHESCPDSICSEAYTEQFTVRLVQAEILIINNPPTIEPAPSNVVIDAGETTFTRLGNFFDTEGGQVTLTDWGSTGEINSWASL